MDITYFYLKDENDVLVLDDNDKPIIRPKPITKPLSALEQAIKEGRPQKGIDATAQKVVDGMNWVHYDTYLTEYEKYLDEVYRITAFNENLSPDEDGGIPPELELPTEPVMAEWEEVTLDNVMTMVGETLTKVARSKDKLNAFEYKGVSCSVTEADQNGWGSITMLFNLAESLGQEFQPINFKNENGNSLLLETRDEWIEFVLLGATKRQEFF